MDTVLDGGEKKNLKQKSLNTYDMWMSDPHYQLYQLVDPILLAHSNS